MLKARYTHGYAKIYGIGSVAEVQRSAAGATYYQYLAMDHRGSVYAVTDASQNILLSYTMDAFGRLLAGVGGSTPTVPNDLIEQSNVRTRQIGGKWYLEFTNRIVPVDEAAFISRDIAFKLNRYGYARGNPVRYFDPNGLDDLSEAQGVLDKLIAALVAEMNKANPDQKVIEDLQSKVASQSLLIDVLLKQRTETFEVKLQPGTESHANGIIKNTWDLSSMDTTIAYEQKNINTIVVVCKNRTLEFTLDVTATDLWTGVTKGVDQKYYDLNAYFERITSFIKKNNPDWQDSWKDGATFTFTHRSKFSYRQATGAAGAYGTDPTFKFHGNTGQPDESTTEPIPHRGGTGKPEDAGEQGGQVTEPGGLKMSYEGAGKLKIADDVLKWDGWTKDPIPPEKYSK
jgi:hypothetical protein